MTVDLEIDYILIHDAQVVPVISLTQPKQPAAPYRHLATKTIFGISRFSPKVIFSFVCFFLSLSLFFFFLQKQKEKKRG